MNAFRRRPPTTPADRVPAPNGKALDAIRPDASEFRRRWGPDGRCALCGGSMVIRLRRRRVLTLVERVRVAEDGLVLPFEEVVEGVVGGLDPCPWCADDAEIEYREWKVREGTR